MKKRTRALTAAALCGAALVALNATSASTLALWSDETRTSTQTLTAARAELLIDGSTAAWQLPASALNALTPAAPQAVALSVEGVSEGNPGLLYSLHAPTQIGATGLTSVVRATITPVPSATGCTPGTDYYNGRLYDGPLAGASVSYYPLVSTGSDVTTGSMVLCLRLSLPAGYGDYVNVATATMDSASGPVTASTQWYGTAAPSIADRTASLAFGFSSQTFRPSPAE